MSYHAETCPVCHGTGQVPAGFYDRDYAYEFHTTGGTKFEVCKSCSGCGWVVVNDSPETDLRQVDNLCDLCTKDPGSCDIINPPVPTKKCTSFEHKCWPYVESEN
jgi:hypothetical protein